MVTKEDLQQKYQQLSTEKLMDIVDNQANYTELAVEVAIAEFRNRKVPKKEILDYLNKRENDRENSFFIYLDRNTAIELNFFQKIMFFFFFFPVPTFWFRIDYRVQGFRLKLRQSYYYSLIGFASLALVVATIVNLNLDLADSAFLGIWMIFFIPAYFLDDFFNKRIRIKKTKKALLEKGYELEM